MARFSRIQVASVMKESGLVPLFYHDDIKTSKKVLRACYKGGARLLEFTNRGDFAHEVFSELNKFAARELPEMIIGVGSPCRIQPRPRSICSLAAISLYPGAA